MSWQSFKHNQIWWRTRKPIAEIAVRLLRMSRRMLRWTGVYCSWCGRDPGMSSSYSRKGLRCVSLGRDCEKEP